MIFLSLQFIQPGFCPIHEISIVPYLPVFDVRANVALVECDILGNDLMFNSGKLPEKTTQYRFWLQYPLDCTKPLDHDATSIDPSSRRVRTSQIP